MDLYKLLDYIYVYVDDNCGRALKIAKKKFTETNDKKYLISKTLKKHISIWIYGYFHHENSINVLKSYFDSIDDDIYMNCEVSQQLISEFDSLDDETKLSRLRSRLITYVSIKYKPLFENYLIADIIEDANEN